MSISSFIYLFYAPQACFDLRSPEIMLGAFPIKPPQCRRIRANVSELKIRVFDTPIVCLKYTHPSATAVNVSWHYLWLTGPITKSYILFSQSPQNPEVLFNHLWVHQWIETSKAVHRRFHRNEKILCGRST